MCELCGIKEHRRTRWYFENEWFAILDCDHCGVPMCVWFQHTMQIEDADMTHMKMELGKIGNKVFGKGNWYFDMERRKIPEHFHFHVRRK